MNRYERQYRGSFTLLLVLFLILFIVSVRFGAVGISWEEILNAREKLSSECHSTDIKRKHISANQTTQSDPLYCSRSFYSQ